uniref:HTH CENPB-type domain-containing protein n=1 Tax=Globodera rostochiensis TaxID=31243 RepID=A0A914IEV5_GLORO
MSDEDSEELVQQRDISKKRRIFTIDEKLEIESASENGKSRSKNYSLCGRLIVRLDGAGRHLRDKEFDDQMIAWIRTQRACNQRVSRRTIQIHALQIANQADEEETIFKRNYSEGIATNKFAEKYSSRQRFKLERITKRE